MHRHAQIDLRIIDNEFGVVVTILMFIGQKLYFKYVYQKMKFSYSREVIRVFEVSVNEI